MSFNEASSPPVTSSTDVDEEAATAKARQEQESAWKKSKARAADRVAAGASGLVPSERVGYGEEGASEDHYGFRWQGEKDCKLGNEALRAYLPILARRALRWKQAYSGAIRRCTLYRTPKLKRFVHKGIPAQLRGDVWMILSGAHGRMRREPFLYKQLLSSSKAATTADQAEPLPPPLRTKAEEQIELDLRRTYPDNRHFRHHGGNNSSHQGSGSSSSSSVGPSKADAENATAMGSATTLSSSEEPLPEPGPISRMRRVLTAFSRFDPELGYTQGMNFVVGILLLVLGDDPLGEERAFWLLVTLAQDIVRGYWEPSLKTVSGELAALEELLRAKDPALSAHLESLGCPLPAMCLKWFLNCFADVLPMETTLRVWDYLFLQRRTKPLFRAALAIMSTGRNEWLRIRDQGEALAHAKIAARACHDAGALCTTMKLIPLKSSEIHHARTSAAAAH